MFERDFGACSAPGEDITAEDLENMTEAVALFLILGPPESDTRQSLCLVGLTLFGSRLRVMPEEKCGK